MRKVRHFAAILIFLGVLTAMNAGAQPLVLLETFDAANEKILEEMKTVPPEAALRGVVRKRPVLLNLDAALAQGVKPGTEIQLPLFDGESVQGPIEKIARRGAVDYSWTGALTGQNAGRFYVSVKEGVMAGMIMLNDGRQFQVTYSGAGVQEINEIDAGQFLECGVEEDDTPDKLPNFAKKPSNTEKTDPSTQFDIMIVYTPLARSNAGGTAAMEAEVANAVALANDTYDNSGINTQMRLVYTGEVSYTEVSAFATNLDRLRETADGYMDEVHALRDQYGADFVALLIDPASPDSCGIASLINFLSTGNDYRAFSVTDRGCILNHSMTHEVGHNQGSQHNREDAGSSPLYTYSYGWRFIGANDSQPYRTVMSYATGDYSSASRIPYFSNPNISYQGTATGIGIGLTNESHNAQSINNAASTFANYRPIAGTISINPQSAITFEGPWGGPFTVVGSDAVTLYNVDSSSLNWTAAVDDSNVSDGGGGFLAPLGVSPSGGTLSAGNNVVLTVAPTADANLMPVGTHQMTLHVMDTTNAEEETLNVILEVRGVDSLEMSAISSPKGAGLPFPVTLTAKDSGGLAVPGFTGTASLNGLVPGSPSDSTIGTLNSIFSGIEASYETARFQMLLLNGELGLGQGTLSALALNIYTVPSPTLLRNFTIRMKNTSRVDFYQSPVVGWESTGWTTVFQGDVNMNSTGWGNFVFSTPFEYDGASSLMIDISFQNNTGEKGTDGVYFVTGTAGAQIMLGAADISAGYGAPTGWVGFNPSPGIGGFRPTVMLTHTGFSSVAVSPSTTGNFSGGGWTGNVTVGSAYSSIRLIADDGNGHTATSDAFQVTGVDFSTVYVDFAHGGAELGTMTYPFNTLGEAVTNVDSGGTVIVNAGSSPEVMTITKPMRIEASGGTVRIGD